MKRIKIWLGTSLVLLGILIIASRPDDRPKVVFCDVGQGDGILIMEGSWQMLVDTGPENGKMGLCLEKYLPFWDKNLEAVIITHGDSDHAGGLKQLEKSYRIEQKMYTGDLLKNDRLSYKSIQIDVWNPDELGEDSNINSLVMLATVGSQKFLLMGDVPAEVEQKMAWRNELQKVDVLKVSHHGSKEATSKELLAVTKPKLAIISVGKNNKFGHPTKEVLERLKDEGVEIKRTDEIGDIIVYGQN